VKPLPESLQVAFVGAGIHAVTIALQLMEDRGGNAAGIGLLDPLGRPMARWINSTAKLGMREMRSAWFQHVHPDMFAMVNEERHSGGDPLARGIFSPPPVEVFNRFCAEMARPLEPLSHQTRVTRVDPIDGGLAGYHLTVEDGGQFFAQSVVYTPGLGGHERVPAAAVALHAARSPHLLLAGQVDVREPSWAGQRVLIAGAGLTGATLAARLTEAGANVTLIHRTAIRQRRWDVDDSWIKNESKLRRFRRIRDLAERLAQVKSARRGSITPETLRLLRRFADDGRIQVLEHTEITSLTPSPRGGLTARLAGRELAIDRVILATGFEPEFQADPLLQSILATPGLQMLGGRPVLNRYLELLPGFYVSGWAAELQLGPLARNILGARIAARLVSAGIRGDIRFARKRIAAIS